MITPEAHSPSLAPMAPSRELFRGNVGDGSLISNGNHVRNGSSFKINSLLALRDSPIIGHSHPLSCGPGPSKLEREVTVSSHRAEEPFPKTIQGSRGSLDVFATTSMNFNQSAPSYRIQANVSADARTLSNLPVLEATPLRKTSLFSRSKPHIKPNIRGMNISMPVTDVYNSVSQHLSQGYKPLILHKAP